jgi:hypothetical protein
MNTRLAAEGPGRSGAAVVTGRAFPPGLGDCSVLRKNSSDLLAEEIGVRLARAPGARGFAG